MKKRQPVLHAGMPASLAYSLIKKIIRSGRPECCDITEPELLDSFRGKLEFRDRHQIESGQLARRALGFRIEAADRLQGIPEEVEAHRFGGAGSIKIDDAAADGIISGLPHGRGARKSVELKPPGDGVHGNHVA